PIKSSIGFSLSAIVSSSQSVVTPSLVDPDGVKAMRLLNYATLLPQMKSAAKYHTALNPEDLPGQCGARKGIERLDKSYTPKL
ncbi:hypothetical protein Tco_1064330, partial [Tanacetum coccineum]